MQSAATTVAQYLAALPPDRRAALATVRAEILRNLDGDYEEGMQYGMIGYYVPHRIYAAGYHCDPKQPLPFAGLASQKNHMAIYLMCVYGSGSEAAWFRGAWAKTGKKLDIGKSCIRFTKIEDVAVDVIGEAIRRVPAAQYVAQYERLRAQMAARPTKGPPGKKPAAKKAAARKGSAKRKAKRS